MIEFESLALLRPWWLLAVPLVGLAGMFAARRWIRLGAWDTAIDPALKALLLRLGRIRPGEAQRHGLATAAAGIIALALTGPARKDGDAAAYRNLDGLVIAIDLSRSLTSGGNLQTALDAARLVVDQAGPRPVALIVYGEDAYVASAFTIDARPLLTTLSVLDGDTVPGAGSSPERALRLAETLLAQSSVITGDVVLVSDGGGLGEAAIAAGARLSERGSRVSTLFVPATAQAPAGLPPPRRGGLDDLAAAGGGVAGAAADPAGVAALMGAKLAGRLAAAGFSLLAWTDYGRLLLAAALLPALLLFRPRH